MTPEEMSALDYARALATVGIPVFVAHPDDSPIGFRLPNSWQTTTPNPRYVDAWRPGLALCAVMGQGLDLIDVDPRNGGTLATLNGKTPTSYGTAMTPSAGVHCFIKSLGVRSRDSIAPGIDIKAGDPDGQGRGFAFIAPTVRASKVTGELVAYRWAASPDIAALSTAADDRSGELLAAMVRAAHGARTGSPGTDTGWTDPDVENLLEHGIPAGAAQDAALRDLTWKLRRQRVARSAASLIWQAVVDKTALTRPGEPWTERDFDRHWGGADRKIDNDDQWFRSATDVTDGDAPTPVANRPPLDVTNSAVSAEWLRHTLGTGPLAGMFGRGSTGIVHTPQIGEDGYVPLTGNNNDDDGPSQICPVDAETLTARIQYSYLCTRLDVRSGERRPAMFPTAAARTAVSAPDMMTNLRQMAGVTHTPIARTDGTILDQPGYDQASRLLYLPEPGLDMPPVPGEPATTDVKAAVALLDEMTGDFPFITEHDRANYYAALLTPLLRQLAPPPYKLIAIGAPQPGSGKSLLATILRIIHGGVFRSETPEDDAELRKQITTILDVTTAPVVTFDNVSGVLRSSTLAGLLTSSRWDDRRLGSTALVSRPNDRLWTITGNNLQLGGDLIRRTMWVTIDPHTPNPERRTGFRIANLEAWAREHRGDIIRALLVLVRAWVVAERPTGPQRGSDGFARWLETVGGILTHAGVPGVVDHPESARQSEGSDDEEWGEFLAAVHGVYGDGSWTTKELLAKVDTRIDLGQPNAWAAEADAGYAISHPLPLDVLPAPLVERVHKAGGKAGVATRSLSGWLRNREGRWADGCVVRSFVDKHDKTKRWQVGIAGSAGSAGSNSDTYGEFGMTNRRDGPESNPAEPAEPARANCQACHQSHDNPDSLLCSECLDKARKTS